MAYAVFGVCTALLAGVAILAVKVVRETRKMAPNKDEDEDESCS